ncbi:glycine hydroxymethyltransferase [Amycolatopsis arida]|uniref:Glycine hydroxymethyltransferase n=1 Tax=Amycolatopsis arida TaxID=587909 RepID=A0A1I5Q2U1_9PSEU|nr:beta-eliminating lyase-related protein [Amycolatopsis arida]TDX98697.1 glycine hydroxymethyltransferase [Amycolatopsis arida]SFP40519.1 glycine hydroxymethyltransferase [Amycolatopsis arida]
MTEIAPWAAPAARRRLQEVAAAVTNRTGPTEVAETVRAALAAHRRQFDDEGIVLYAGTNVPSSAALAAYDPAVSTRPSMGWPGEKYQTGLDHLDTLEVLAPLLVAERMAGRFAEVRLPSATMANLAVYRALAEPGDTVAVLPEAAGGHASHHAYGAAGIRGLRVVDLPYDAGALGIDHAALPGFLRAHRPRLVVVGASLMLFPHDVARVRAAVDEVGATLVYDASHVAGLVATGLFQRPLPERAHVVTFSTYKSYGGPPGGCVVTRDERLAERISLAAYPGMLANYDVGRLGALAIATAELGTPAGRRYAERCAGNARAFAEALHDAGFAVTGAGRGFTRSHHVAVDAAGCGGGEAAAARLAAAGIYLSAIGLPGQGPVAEGLRGLRIGTQEVTRRGFGAEHLRVVAALMRHVLLDGTDPAEIRPEVVALRRSVSEKDSTD